MLLLEFGPATGATEVDRLPVVLETRRPGVDDDGHPADRVDCSGWSWSRRVSPRIRARPVERLLILVLAANPTEIDRLAVVLDLRRLRTRNHGHPADRVDRRGGGRGCIEDRLVGPAATDLDDPREQRHGDLGRR